MALLFFEKEIPNSFEVVRYTEKHKCVWDSCVREATTSHFLFYRDYMNYHSDRFIDHSLLIFDAGKLISVFPANEIKSEIISHGGLTFGGLLYGKKVKSIDVINILSSIVSYYKKNNIKKITYKPIPWTYHIVPSEIDLYALFLLGFKLKERHLASSIDYSNIIPLAGGRKNQIQKAKKNDIILRESNDWDAFLILLTEILNSRHGVNPVHTAYELDLLQKKFPDNIKLWFAEKNDIILAGTVLYISNRVVHTQYMASSDEGYLAGALDFLIKKLIDDYSSQKMFFSFGVSTESNGKTLNQGLLFQKESFGARSVVHDIWSLDL